MKIHVVNLYTDVNSNIICICYCDNIHLEYATLVDLYWFLDSRLLSSCHYFRLSHVL